MGGQHPIKLLFDQNLAPSLKRRLADLGAELAHVADFGLASGDDDAVWKLASEKGYTIVSKDDDFRDRVSLHGPPPKVVLLKLGNTPLSLVQHTLRRVWPLIIKLHEDEAASLLLVTPESAFLLIRSERQE